MITQHSTSYFYPRLTMVSSQTIAFFGATGGCALACLTRSIKAGHSCRALARTPAALLNLLKDAGVTDMTNLVIITGAVDDKEVVVKVLEAEDGSLVSTIIFGIGARPVFKKYSLLPSIDQPHICATGISTILSAVESLSYAVPPHLAVVSTTGLSSTRDVPILLVFLYHWLLHVPHVDKRNMENLVVQAAKRGILSGFAIVRASLLTSGEANDEKVRVDIKEVPEKNNSENVGNKAIGYTVSRQAVGSWIFRNLIEGGDGAWGPAGGGEVVTLTH